MKQKNKKKSEEQISKYRELLKGIQDKEKKLQEDRDMEMEITWVPGTTRSRLIQYESRLIQLRCAIGLLSCSSALL